ncbi:hypothetical protein [Streptomyces sp. NRRL S-87]|uniref:hypothetical protein n=1 Tax=Streptomyces sp. NRRL S-87 TaxID=1463920 RepID=UPI000A9650E3|nr:hypothetical protein [Streptomyces sp. NRRL S-87]
MFARFSTRRLVLAGASVALVGGGVALPAGAANTGNNSCKGKCTISTGNAKGGDASADAVNTGDATSVSGDATGAGGTVKNIKKDIKKEVLKKIGK